MGYIRHDAILVTTLRQEDYDKVLRCARSIFGDNIGVSQPVVNSYQTLMVPPDGSKEGWEPSNEGDQRRKRFKQWLRECPLNGIYPEWVEVSYGGDYPESSQVTDHPGFSDNQPPSTESEK